MRVLIITIFFVLSSFSQILGQCSINDLIVEAHPCDNGMFLLDLDFNPVGTTDSFIVAGNGNNYGTFAYDDLFLTLGPFVGDGSTIYELVITDLNNSNCTAFTTIGPIDCSSGSDCELSNLEVSIGDCNPNGTYFLIFDFDYQNTSNDFFDLFVNGTFFGFYEFANLPVTIPAFPRSGNDNDYIQVCQNDLPTCCTDLEFDSPNCNEDCAINDLIVEAYDCDNGMFLVDIDFNFVGTSDSFQVAGNGNNYGTFAYDDLYITLGPLEGNGTTPYEFVIIDNDNPNCTAVFELGIIDCNDECELWDLDITNFGDCTSESTYTITINFLYENVTTDFFDLFGNGQFLGFYAFNDLPLTIIDFPASGEDYDYIQVCQNDLPTCCTDLEFEAIDCSKITSIENSKTNQLQIYPNPVQDFIFIKNESPQLIQEIIISDALGKTLETTQGNINQIDVSTFAEGVYFLQIKIENSWLTKRVLIHKN